MKQTETATDRAAFIKKSMADAKAQTAKLTVLPPVKFAFNANLKGGGDAAAAKELTRRFMEAQTGMRRIVALGLFAWELKETRLKHGEFGPWLATHCPKLATVDSVTGKPKTSRALSGYMELTKGVLESVGYPTVEKYLAKAAEFPAGMAGGKFLLLADKKVPEEMKPLRDEIFELVDGKTQRALFLEFKQAEDDDEGTAKAKRGRLKGQGGVSAEQRAKAAEREEEERIAELMVAFEEATAWNLEQADAKGAGTQNLKLLWKWRESARTLIAYIDRLEESRKGGQQ